MNIRTVRPFATEANLKNDAGRGGSHEGEESVEAGIQEYRDA